jgi:hypothetical protein
MRTRRSDIAQQATENLIRECVVFTLSKTTLRGTIQMEERNANNIFDSWLDEERLRAEETQNE